MKRRLIALAFVLCAGVGVTVWLLTRAGGPRKYATPEAAVLAECHADHAKAEVPLSPKQQGNEWHAYGRSIQTHWTVSWTAAGSPTVWIALTQHAYSGRYWVIKGKSWVNDCKYARMGAGYSLSSP